MNITAKRRNFISGGSLLLIGAAGMLAAVTSQAAQPADHIVGRTAVVVHYSDLNLATADGTRILYARLSRAATQACGGEPAILALRQRQIYQACYDHALDKAVKKVDSSRLQALHLERTASHSVG